MSESDPGLCARCRHARTVRPARGTVFLRCGQSDADPRYPRYPRLPVLECGGFEADGHDREEREENDD